MIKRCFFSATILVSVSFNLAEIVMRNFEQNDDYDTETFKKKLIKITPKPILGGKEQISLPHDEGAPTDIEGLFALFDITLDEHEVLTPDGWILTVHRINPRVVDPDKVVFLMHGIYGSSEDWFFSPKENLPLLLFGEGYDVWLGNARGNRYGKAHSSISVDCNEYWDFSWDEVGRYDVTASLKYILKKTGQLKLFYVGYSQGATSGLVALAENQELNDRIDMFFAIAPVTYLKNTKSPVLKAFSSQSEPERTIQRHIGTENLNVQRTLVSSIAKILCKNGTITQYICSNFLFDLCGFNKQNLNIGNLPLIMKRWPSSGSSRNLLHYIQVADSGKFRPFVFNESKNELTYDAKMPPEYNLTFITAPVVLLYSKSDWLTHEMDIKTLKKKLESIIKTVSVKGYTHTDFIFGNDASDRIFKRIIGYLTKYTDSKQEDEHPVESQNSRKTQETDTDEQSVIILGEDK